MLCVDGSAAATAATRVAIALARETARPLYALHVLEDSGLAVLVDRARDGHDARVDQVATGAALDTRVRAMATDAGIEVVWSEAEGRPFEQILERARALQPEYIVMGRAGRRGPGRALLGSQVEHVIEFTEWPVIVVPAPAPA